jgi:hypothetical protein
MQTGRQLASRIAAATLDPLFLFQTCAGNPRWLPQTRYTLEASPDDSLTCRRFCLSLGPPSDPDAETRAATRAAVKEIPRWSNNASVHRLKTGAVPPWTPTSQLAKRKVYPKRMRHILQELDKEYEQNMCRLRDPKDFPSFMTGDVITVKIVCSSTTSSVLLQSVHLCSDINAACHTAMQRRVR